MKRFLSTLCLSGLVLGLSSTFAQDAKSAAAKAKDAAAAKLKEASSANAEAAKHLKEMTSELKSAEAAKIPVKERAVLEALLKEAEKPDADSLDVAQRLQDTLKSSSPEAQKLLGKTPESAPGAPKTGKASSTGARTFANVEPPPPKVVANPGNKEKKASTSALIIDSQRLFMHSANRIANFKGDVRLRSTDVDADCEELEVIFKEGALETLGDPGAAEAGAKPKDNEAPTTTATPAGEQKSAEEEKIEKIWLKGNGRMITIIRRHPDGDAVCHAKQAIYDTLTGTLLLKEYPEVEHLGKRLAGNTPAGSITITKDMQITGTKDVRMTLDNTKLPKKRS
jgi:hypothetical protein